VPASTCDAAASSSNKIKNLIYTKNLRDMRFVGLLIKSIRKNIKKGQAILGLDADQSSCPLNL
jgi:hypothetical protein